MKGIYLGACLASHPNYDIVYQDIDGTRDIGGDMLDVDLSPYDYIICTPPCNFWTKLNSEYWRSEYSLRTRHLLPIMLIRLSKLGKPFIIENVVNMKRYKEHRIMDIVDAYHIHYQVVGRHIYFNNTPYIDLMCQQHQDFGKGGTLVNNDGYRQGGSNVHNVVEIWLKGINL